MIWLDFETFSETPIKHGTYRYCAEAEAMILAYAFDDGPVSVWDITADPRMPGDLEMMLDDESEPITAHNAMFDFGFINSELKACGRSLIQVERIVDTLTMARAKHPGAMSAIGCICAIMACCFCCICWTWAKMCA